MFSILALVLSLMTQPATTCETYAPRLDGISVTVCGGSVVKACDASGVCTTK